MPSINIRKPFAAAFAVLLLIAAYLGLSTQKIPQYGQVDKGLHFIAFFLLTLTFYWVLETSRRRVIHITLIVCTAVLAIGSEVVQGILPNGRNFDPYDILANVVGSGLAVFLCSWYHKRMLERRRKNKHYDIVPGDDAELGDDPERDVELGEGVGFRSQETGVIPAGSNGQAESHKTNVTEELDNWDENAEDWDEEPADEPASDSKASAAEATNDTKKRTT